LVGFNKVDRRSRCLSIAPDSRKNDLRRFFFQYFFKVTKPEALHAGSALNNVHANALMWVAGFFGWCVRPRRGVGVARCEVKKIEIVFLHFCRASFVLLGAFPATANHLAAFLEARACTNEAVTL
jgi:hypothetical protein